MWCHDDGLLFYTNKNKNMVVRIWTHHERIVWCDAFVMNLSAHYSLFIRKLVTATVTSINTCSTYSWSHQVTIFHTAKQSQKYNDLRKCLFLSFSFVWDKCCFHQWFTALQEGLLSSFTNLSSSLYWKSLRNSFYAHSANPTFFPLWAAVVWHSIILTCFSQDKEGTSKKGSWLRRGYQGRISKWVKNGNRFSFSLFPFLANCNHLPFPPAWSQIAWNWPEETEICSAHGNQSHLKNSLKAGMLKTLRHHH